MENTAMTPDQFFDALNELLGSDAGYVAHLETIKGILRDNKKFVQQDVLDKQRACLLFTQYLEQQIELHCLSKDSRNPDDVQEVSFVVDEAWLCEDVDCAELLGGNETINCNGYVERELREKMPLFIQELMNDQSNGETYEVEMGNERTHWHITSMSIDKGGKYITRGKLRVSLTFQQREPYVTCFLCEDSEPVSDCYTNDNDVYMCGGCYDGFSRCY